MHDDGGGGGQHKDKEVPGYLSAANKSSIVRDGFLTGTVSRPGNHGIRATLQGRPHTRYDISKLSLIHI